MHKTKEYKGAAFKAQFPFHALSVLVTMLVYGVLFTGFYRLYVPLVTSFQAILVPILVLTAVVTMINREWGLLLFIFCVPLINCLPYFFGMDLNVPHAPTALVLFLVFSPAWFLSGYRRREGLRWDLNVARPLFLLLLFAGISAAITAWRFSNFYPIWSSHFRDLIVNANAVRAGGAMMSTVMSFLNYATGLVFFGIVIATVRSRILVRKILLTLCVSAFLACGFALVQIFYSLDLGNTALFAGQGRVNATLKDPNSFGWFISLLLPLCLGMVLASKGRPRIFLALSCVLALLVMPFIGSRSGLLASMAGLSTFLLLINVYLRWPLLKKMVLTAGTVLVAGVILALLWNVSGRASLRHRLEENVQAVTQNRFAQILNPGRAELWKAGAEMVLDYPWTGVGTGSFIVEYPNYRVRKGDQSAHSDSAENYFLQIGSELGLAALVVSAWLFFMIFRLMWVRCSGIDRGDPQRWILFGTIAAVTAASANFLFHSYIGSFEVKYLFWLCVALVAVFPGDSFAPSKTRSLFGGKKILGGLMLASLLLFGAGHLWHSMRGLSISHATEEFGWQQNFGLYAAEEDERNMPFNWTKESAGISIRNLHQELVLPIRASHPGIEVHPVRFEVFRADEYFNPVEFLGEYSLQDTMWKNYAFPFDSVPDVSIHLIIETDRPWQPQDVLGVPDARQLAVGLGQPWFRPPSGEGTDYRILQTIPAKYWRGEQLNLLYHNGSAHINFDLLEPGASLRINLRGGKALGVGPLLQIHLNRGEVARLILEEDGWNSFILARDLAAGNYRLAVLFMNDLYLPDKNEDRFAVLGDIELVSRDLQKSKTDDDLLTRRKP